MSIELLPTDSEIRIVDIGRGPQLSTSRITMQDFVPYFKEGDSYEDIQRYMPVVAREEIAVAEAYYREHRAELREVDRRIEERARLRRNPPEVDARIWAGILRRRAEIAARAEAMEGSVESAAR